jgi:peptide/nickel transport system permease protein
VTIASSVPNPEDMGIVRMALILSIVSWVQPTRAIRAQVLSMRERAFVMMAKLSGMSGMEIIIKELMPNLMPYLAISLAGAVNGGVLGSLGLQTLGIGNLREPSLGMTIYWLRYYNAFLQGYWWWIVEPVVVIALIFIAFLLLSIGLDEFANPRTRRTV